MDKYTYWWFDKEDGYWYSYRGLSLSRAEDLFDENNWEGYYELEEECQNG